MYEMGRVTEKPKRWATVKRALFGDLFGPDGTQPVADHSPNETVTGIEDAKLSSLSWQMLQDRKSIYTDLEKIDREDEVISTALDITADNAVGADGIKVHSDNATAQKVLEDLFRRLNMDDLAWQIARNAAKHGCPYYEIILDRKTNRISGLKDQVYYRITPQTNTKGDKIPGWLYTVEGANIGQASQTIQLEEWQILEFPFGRKLGLYTFPALATIRKNWTRLSMLEDGMAIARLTRAYDKLVHHIPVEKTWNTGEIINAIRRYKDAVTKKSFTSAPAAQRLEDNPLSVQTDFYLPDDGTKRGGVESLSSVNNQLLRLDDVYYHRERILARLMVPIQYLQIMSTQKTHLRAGGSLTDAEKQFNKMLERLQASLRRGLQRLCDMELMLNGILPTPGLYTLEMLAVTSTDEKMAADINLTNGQAASYFVEAFGYLPPEIITNLFLRLTEEQKKLFADYIAADGKQVKAAKLKKLATDAAPKPVPAGPKKQDSEALIDMFASMHAQLLEESAGEIDPETIRERITSQLHDISTLQENPF